MSYVVNNGPRGVSEDLRQRVLAAMAALNYTPNALLVLFVRGFVKARSRGKAAREQAEREQAERDAEARSA